MAKTRENSQVDDDFHEETPQEFASQPDRDFSKFRPAGTPDEEQSGSQSSQSSGSQKPDKRQNKVSDE